MAIGTSLVYCAFIIGSYTSFFSLLSQTSITPLSLNFSENGLGIQTKDDNINFVYNTARYEALNNAVKIYLDRIKTLSTATKDSFTRQINSKSTNCLCIPLIVSAVIQKSNLNPSN